MGAGGNANAQPCRFWRNQDVRQKTEMGAGAKQAEGPHGVNFMQNGPRRKRNTLLISVVVVNQVSLKATFDTGAAISLVHSSSLKCWIENDVLP